MRSHPCSDSAKGPTTENFERARRDAYFTEIAGQFAPATRPAALLVTHLLPERPSFVRAAAALTQRKAVLPKPKSIDTATAVRRTTAMPSIARMEPVRKSSPP
jgi:adenosylhomocysteinase